MQRIKAIIREIGLSNILLIGFLLCLIVLCCAIVGGMNKQAISVCMSGGHSEDVCRHAIDR